MGRGVNDIYAGKKGGHINLCTHIGELCYTKPGRGGEGQQKCASKRVGSGEIEHGLPPLAPALPL